MVHRLGMYYLARRLQDAQDAKAAYRRGHKAPDRYSVSDREEVGELARMAAALLGSVGTLALILWLAS